MKVFKFTIHPNASRESQIQFEKDISIEKSDIQLAKEKQHLKNLFKKLDKDIEEMSPEICESKTIEVKVEKVKSPRPKKKTKKVPS